MLEPTSMTRDCASTSDVCYYFFDLFETLIEFDAHVSEWKFWWALVQFCFPVLRRERALL